MTSKEKKITKIAFIGTHGTAKTTTAHDLVTRLKKKSLNLEINVIILLGIEVF